MKLKLPNRRGRTVLLVVLSLCLSLPALMSGWFNDDFYFDNPLIRYDTPFEYYDFVEKLGRTDSWSWWSVSGIDIRFFRPLSSLTLYLDFEVFGGRPLIAHLHSSLWFVVLLLGAYKLIDALLPPKATPLAALAFSVGIYHGMALGWVAARHAVVGGAFVVWSTYAYIRSRADGNRRYGFASAFLLVLSLLSSEVGLTVGLFVFAYEGLLKVGSLKDRFNAALPVFAVTFLYLLFYSLSGYGPKGSGLYLDPLRQPPAYLAALGPKILALEGAYLLGFPAMLKTVPGAETVPPLVGAAGLALLFFAMFVAGPFDAHEKKLLRFLFLMSVLCILPAAAGLPDGRGTQLSSVATAGILGVVIARLSALRTELRHSILVRLCLYILLIGAVALPSMLRLTLAVVQHRISTLQETQARSELPCTPGAHVFLVNGEFMAAIYKPLIITKYQGRIFDQWTALTEPDTDLVVTRTNENSLEIASESPLVNDMMYRLTRPMNQPIATGASLEKSGFRVYAAAASALGPTKAVFTIAHLTDPERVCLLTSDKGFLKPFSLPDLGQSVRIPFALPDL